MATNWTNTLDWEQNNLRQKGISFLANGFHRSYNDSAVATERQYYQFGEPWFKIDTATKTVCASGNCSLKDILESLVEHQLFLPVVPGTQNISIGGAIAHDVHGKNFSTNGSFGHHLLEIEIEKSSGDIISCSPNSNSELFYSTIGGLGLTGVIKSAKIQAIQQSPWHSIKNFKFSSVKEYLDISSQLMTQTEFQAAWVSQCQLTPFEGIIYTSTPAELKGSPLIPKMSVRKLPHLTRYCSPLFRKKVISAINLIKFKKDSDPFLKGIVPYYKTLFPLDSIENWNLAFRKNGFYQHQSLIPFQNFPSFVTRTQSCLKSFNQFSHLIVCKTFQKKQSLGPLGFCKEGVSLSIDILNKGQATTDLIKALNNLALECDGQLYMAKDAYCTKEMFAQMKGPETIKKFLKHKDPLLNSYLWRRIYG